MRNVASVALILLVLALFLTVDGFLGGAYRWLGIAEADSQWLEMGTLALLIVAFCLAIKITDWRHRRRR